MIVPAPRNLFALLFLPGWLVGWVLGEVVVIASLLAGGSRQPLFLMVWLVFWTLGGGYAALMFLRMLVGKEHLELERDVFRVRQEVFGIGRSREYELRHVQNLRVSGTRVPAPWRQFMAGQGTIAFDYGAKTIHIGDGLEEAEARQIITRMQERHRLS